MSRKVLLIVTAVVVAVLAAGAGVYVFARGGEDAREAVLDHVEDRSGGSAEILAQQDWGEGQLVLVGYDTRGVRRLGLAFAAEGMLGWRVRSYTEEAVEPDDVVVGSLLIASSEGGDGQPAWTAAVGELIDTRIERVEITWSSGTGVGPRTGEAYMIVERGATTATEARYLAENGQEIARVPVDQD